MKGACARKECKTRGICQSIFHVGAEPPLRPRQFVACLSRYQRYLAKLRSRRETIERRANVRHLESCVDDGLHQAAVEHVEQFVEFANASTGPPVDFQLSDEHPLQSSRML